MLPGIISRIAVLLGTFHYVLLLPIRILSSVYMGYLAASSVSLLAVSSVSLLAASSVSLYYLAASSISLYYLAASSVSLYYLAVSSMGGWCPHLQARVLIGIDLNVEGEALHTLLGTETQTISVTARKK
jgi:hypothetical protein